MVFLFFYSHSECANTEQILERQVLRERWVQFFQLSDDSNPGRLGGKRERFLCVMPSPNLWCMLDWHVQSIFFVHDFIPNQSRTKTVKILITKIVDDRPDQAKVTSIVD